VLKLIDLEHLKASRAIVPDIFSSKNISERKLLTIFVILFSLFIILGGLAAYQLPEPTGPQQPTVTDVVAALPTATAVSSPTRVPTFTPTSTPLPTPTKTSTSPPPTPTSTRVVPEEIYSGGTVQAIKRATAQANSKLTVETHLETDGQNGPTASFARAIPKINRGPGSRLVLAHYFAWFDGGGWDDCNISAGDKPLEPYHSDDPAAIARHVELAMYAGLDGFTLHWFTPGGRTDRNFAALLAQSEGHDFSSTVVFSRHFWPGSPPASRQTITEALRYILDRYSGHPNFLRWEDKPVILFIDSYRVPVAAGETAQQFWAAIRDEVDPQRQSWWITEGLDASYLAVFDGLYVFKISHAASLHDYVKSSRWGNQVRAWADQTGRPKLWLATISPGWDDLRAGCKPDVRVPNTLHRLDRAGGAVYEATFQAALDSNPDWLILSSFNEWVEGSYIEPSVQYGDKYLQMTKDLVERFQQGN
jgi:hypothetical protein